MSNFVIEIKVPSGIIFEYVNNILRISGKKGEIGLDLKNFLFNKKESSKNVFILSCEKRDDIKRKEISRAKAILGTFGALIRSHMVGVSKGHRVFVNLVGIGYRVVKTNDKSTESGVLSFKLGFSHQILVEIPKDLEVFVKNNGLRLEICGVEKAAVGDFAVKLQRFRRPEPYKGKGLHIEGKEYKFVRKEGKKS